MARGSSNLRKSMTALLTAVLWVVGLLAIWTLFLLLYRLTEYVWRPAKAEIGDFVVDGQSNPTYATKFLDRWLSFRSSGPVGLVQGLPALPESDFILADIAQRSGSELEMAVGDLGKDFEIKFAGISIQNFAAALDKLLRPAGSVVEGRISRFGNEVSLTVKVREGSRTLKDWIANRSFVGAKGSDEQTAAEEALIDEAICEVGLFLGRLKRGPLGNGVEMMGGAPDSLTAQALAELKKGRRSLERYVHDNQQDDLLAAQQHFRALVANSPAYTDGYFLLSQALAENRQEREAIEVYDRALRLLSHDPHADEKRSFEARFLKASSLLRCYQWLDVVKATAEFQKLTSDLAARTATKVGKENKAELTAWRQNCYMLARAHAEMAHCLGHLLVLLPKNRSIRADFLPDLVTLFGDGIAKAIASPDKLTDRRKIADRLYAFSQAEQKKAASVDPIYETEWKADLQARLSEVKGYAQFRHAEWIAANVDAEFQSECNAALRGLQQAELRKPRSYALLQNIGMVYLSRRFAPDTQSVEHAERYYTQSIALKPGDYYGYQQLARAALRRALGAADSADRSEAIKRAGDLIAKSQKLRPESQTTRFLSLYLRFVSLGLAPKTMKLDDVNALLDDVPQQGYGEHDILFRWLRVACEWLRAQASADDKAFPKATAQLKVLCVDFVTSVTDQEDTIWRVDQMRAALAQLAEKLDSISYTDRFKVKFKLDAALE
jgi:tetratricopeptide (TPR) repeat protein